MEWLFCVVLAGFCLFLVVPPSGRRAGLALVLVVVALSGAGALAWNLRHQASLGNLSFVETKLPHLSRVEDGYVSSDRCAACHPSQYNSWHQTYHRTMTQLAKPGAVRGKFDQVSLELEGTTYRLERRGDEFWAELPNPEWSMNSATRLLGPAPQVWRRVGMMTGSHHMQVYWIPTETNLPTNLQNAFPFAYLFDDERWVPLRDTFLRDPDVRLGGGVWNLNCIDCHATVGQSRFDQASGLLDTRVGELGIACEACHGPGAEHVRANNNPLRRYLLHRDRGADTTIVNPSRLSSKRASEVCGRCHSITWIPNQKQFRLTGSPFSPGMALNTNTPVVQPASPGEMPADLNEGLRQHPSFLKEHYWPDGMVRVSGRDYNGLIESPCFKKGDLSCLSCHSLHQSDPINQVAAGMESNEACLQCHKQFRNHLTTHTHHAADSSGSLCYNCHMQRTTYGLLKAIRNHFIENPSAATSARVGRPNGCNLCHLDRSLGWTDQHLVTWFGSKPSALSEEERTVSAVVLWALRGDAGQRALAAWHMGWEPALKASGAAWEAPYLAPLLADPYSAVRYIASRSLKKLPGFQNFSYDFETPVGKRSQARDGALAHWHKQAAPDRRRPELLIGGDGKLQEDKIAGLLKRRDDTSMDLQE